MVYRETVGFGQESCIRTKDSSVNFRITVMMLCATMIGHDVSVLSCTYPIIAIRLSPSCLLFYCTKRIQCLIWSAARYYVSRRFLVQCKKNSVCRYVEKFGCTCELTASHFVMPLYTVARLTRLSRDLPKFATATTLPALVHLNRFLSTMYPPILPYETGKLSVSKIHTL